MSYTIEKITDTRVKKITPITEQFKEEETSLDDVNAQIDSLDVQIANYLSNAQSIFAEVEKLKVKKADFVALKQAIKAAGGKTKAEVQEAELQISLDKEEIV